MSDRPSPSPLEPSSDPAADSPVPAGVSSAPARPDGAAEHPQSPIPAPSGPPHGTPPPAAPPHGAQPGAAWFPPPYPTVPQAPPAPPRRDRPFARAFGLGAGAGLGVSAALIVGTVVASIVGGMILAGLGALAGGLSGPNQVALETDRTVWGEATASKKLRAIPIAGAIMAESADGLALTASTYGYEVADVLDGLDAADSSGVVLLINTPGGSINGSKAMADAIERYQERTGQKVFAYVQGMSASGGMYTMAGADEILADHGSLVGSVGVIMGPISHFDGVIGIDGGLLSEGVTTTGGITQEYITAGRGKDLGNPFREMTAEERSTLQSFIDQEYRAFVSHVANGRGIAESVMTDEVGAAILGTERAREVGYIDGVMGRTEAFTHFAEAAGLDPADTRLVQSSEPGLWATLLGAESRPWGVAPAATPVNGVPATATSTLCTATRTPMVWYGPAAAVCG